MFQTVLNLLLYVLICKLFVVLSVACSERLISFLLFQKSQQVKALSLLPCVCLLAFIYGVSVCLLLAFCLHTLCFVRVIFIVM